jgi:hypothetical protein
MFPLIPKETKMQYKTMVLELLEQHTELYNQLRSERMLLPALDLLASQLKTSHEAWKNRLSQQKPGSAPSQIASEALELVLKELEDYLTSRSSPDDIEPLSLEGAMAFIRGRTPRA